MNKKTILVVEDNEDVRDNLQEILELAGYNVCTAVDGVDGVETVKAANPDLILCDVMMPRLDGYGMLRILNDNPVFMQIPFMFLTAKAEKEDFRKGMGLGADDYITKPFDDVQLLDAIEMRLRKSTLLQSITNEPQQVYHFLNEAKAQEALSGLMEAREVRSYPVKSVVYKEGQVPNYLYYVQEGAVKSYKSSDTGKELITTMYNKGDFFGFVSLLNENPYHDTAETIHETDLLLIPASDFRLLMYNDRDFSAQFIRLLASHADQSEGKLLDLAFSSVRRKVAKALVRLMEQTDAVAFAINRDDLAAMTGTARETVIRTVSDFKSEGLIEVQDGQIIVRDATRLRQLPQ